MATGNTTYGSISQRTAYHAAAEMLAHAEPQVVIGKFGATKPIPRNTAKQVKFRRPKPFAAATTPLVEGVTPTAVQMEYEDVEVTLNQYGNVSVITDVVEDTAEDPVLQDAAMMMGENVAETMESIGWGVIKAGTNVFYSNGSARGDVNTAVALADIRAAVRAIRGDRGKYVTRMLDGSPNYATRPIEAAFIAFAHTDLEADIRDITGFIPVADYGSRQPVSEYELGTVENVRFLTTPVLTAFADAGAAVSGTVSTTGVNSDVYPIIVVAQDAYGHVPLRGQGAVEPRIINPGEIDKSDPLGQRGYAGWKAYYAAIRLNELWMARIECAATAL